MMGHAYNLVKSSVVFATERHIWVREKGERERERGAGGGGGGGRECVCSKLNCIASGRVVVYEQF